MLFRKTELTQPFYKLVSIHIVPENSASTDAPANDVMLGTWRIYSGLTWHEFF